MVERYHRKIFEIASSFLLQAHIIFLDRCAKICSADLQSKDHLAYKGVCSLRASLSVSIGKDSIKCESFDCDMSGDIRGQGEAKVLGTPNTPEGTLAIRAYIFLAIWHLQY